jgi:hypothetical protein
MGALNACVRWRPAVPSGHGAHITVAGLAEIRAAEAASREIGDCSVAILSKNETRSLRIAHDCEASGPGPPRLGG